MSVDFPIKTFNHFPSVNITFPLFSHGVRFFFVSSIYIYLYLQVYKKKFKVNVVKLCLLIILYY